MVIGEVPIPFDQVLKGLDDVLGLLLPLGHQLALHVLFLRVLIIIMQIKYKIFLDVLTKLVEPNLQGTYGAILCPLLLAVFLIQGRELLEEGAVCEVQVSNFPRLLMLKI